MHEKLLNTSVTIATCERDNHWQLAMAKSFNVLSCVLSIVQHCKVPPTVPYHAGSKFRNLLSHIQ